MPLPLLIGIAGAAVVVYIATRPPAAEDEPGLGESLCASLGLKGEAAKLCGGALGEAVEFVADEATCSGATYYAGNAREAQVLRALAYGGRTFASSSVCCEDAEDWAPGGRCYELRIRGLIERRSSGKHRINLQGAGYTRPRGRDEGPEGADWLSPLTSNTIVRASRG